MASKSDGYYLKPPPYEYAQRSGWWAWRRGQRLACLAILAIGFITILHGPSISSVSTSPLNTEANEFAKGLESCRETKRISSNHQPTSAGRQNPRWNPVKGQKTPTVIRNATLFDGETTLNGVFDITFDSGIIRSVLPSSPHNALPKDALIVNANGRFVTPGLVDMHSHHLLLPFPQLRATSDVNERPLLGPTTPFVRAIDGFKPYDPAVKFIASGGITSSLILPGSANIIGGEAYLVKNFPLAGEFEEPVVEELLLDYGVPKSDQKRYLKMACGENPKGIYGNSRLGLSWLLREHLEQAEALKVGQDAWCERASALQTSRFATASRISAFLKEFGSRPQSLKLDTSVSLLRGELNVNIHCYEPEDFERMTAVLHEFGVHPSAFHHALEAWQVPELLKKLEGNITVATFADNSLFKAEAYHSNLKGPKILEEHGIPVALKSDHTGEANNAKYLAHQAAISHSFGLSRDGALQSITSIPARSIKQDHRIGFIGPGYDADIVIWDDHPLQFGATPTKVFIDGRDLLGEGESLPVVEEVQQSEISLPSPPKQRTFISEEDRDAVCTPIESTHSAVVLSGIRKVLVDAPPHLQNWTDDSVLVVENGRITCFDERARCLAARRLGDGVPHIQLENGYVTPGLIAFGNNLGIVAIPSESSTGDGSPGSSNALDETKGLHFAKYGVHFGGRAFKRARTGGVTKAVTAPIPGSGVVQGVSVGLRTSENATLLEDGIWKDEVALHIIIGHSGIGGDTPTISSGIERLRQILEQGKLATESSNKVYSRAAKGDLPVVVQAFNEDDIAQVILVKQDFPATNLVIYGGHASPLVAKSLAKANIPVLLTGNRGAPDNWEKRHILPGPPQSDSPSKTLIDAGVLVGLGVKGDSKIHGLAQEARWAAKYANLSDKDAIDLVSTNIEKILRIQSKSVQLPGGQSLEGLSGDIVVWEGDPLRGEGSVVATFSENGKVSGCWPDTLNADV